MNRRSEYRAKKTYEEKMFKKLKRACMSSYEKDFKKRFPNETFKDYYRMMLKDYHLDYVKYSYRKWKNGPGCSQKRLMKMLRKTIFENAQ